MNSRATLSLLFLFASVALTQAADFEIVVPDSDAFRKANGFVIYDTSGQIKKGDRITKVTYGGLPSGAGNSRIVAGAGTVSQPLIGMPGTIRGFDGKVQLGSGQGPDSAPLGGVVEIKPNTAPPVTQTLWASMMSPPWIWFVAFGSAAVFTAFILNLRIRGNYFMANKQSRNAFLDAVAEIKERLDGIETTQHNLVKKPPVLKHFDQQIKLFDSRLGSLETLASRNQEAFESTQGHLDALESNYTQIAGASEAAQRDYASVQIKLERLDQAVTTTSTGLTTKFQQVLDKQLAMEAAFGQISKLDESVRGLQKDIASADSRLRALAEQVSVVDRKSAESAGKLSDAHNELTGQVTVLANQLSAVGTQAEKNGAIAEGLSQLLKNLQEAVGREDAQKELEAKLQASLTKLGEELAKLSGENAKLKSDLSGLNNTWVKSFESFEASMKELHRSQSAAPNLAELISAVESQRGTKGSKDSEAGDLRFKALATDLASMRQELEARMETMTAPLGNLSKLRTDIEDQMRALTEPLTNLGAMRQEMDAKIAALASPIEQLLRQSNEQPRIVYLPSEAKQDVPVAAAAPKQEESTVAQIVLEPTKKQEPAPSVETAPSAPVAQTPAEVPHGEPEPESDDSYVVGSTVWQCAGGSAAKLWSASLGTNQALIKADKPVRPLTPVDTPAAKHSVGAAVYLDGRVVYAHGDAVRAFWPGRDENTVSLYGAMPHDDWRFLVQKRTAFCVQQDRVEIISLTGWSTQHVFNGHYVGQIHTGELWAGLVVVDDALSVDFRDNNGVQQGKPRKLKVPMTESATMASSGSDVFVLSESGKLFAVRGDKVDLLATLGAGKQKATQLSVVGANVYAVLQNAQGVVVAAYDTKKNAVRDLSLDGKFNGQAVVMGSTMYLSRPDSNEVTVVNLRKMSVGESRTVVGAIGIRKMVGLYSGKEHFLALVTKDFDNKAGRAIVYDLKSGTELTLCPVDQPHVDLVPADNKLVVITSTSYQNIVRVFAPFVAEARAAA